MPQDLSQFERPAVPKRIRLHRFLQLQELSRCGIGQSDYVPCFDGEHPAILANRLRSRLSVDRLTSPFRWSVRQKKHGVIVKKVGTWGIITELP